MTDTEYDILDELYFVTPFNTLREKTQLPATELENSLRGLLEQDYIKCFYPDPDTELAYEVTSFGALVRDCYFLATKPGLLAHNSR